MVPLLAVAGTLVERWLSFETEKVAAVPLNFTLVAPVNPVPVSVTLVPAVPLVGEKLEIAGAGTVTEKLLAEVALPFGVTTPILPEVAPLGTVAVICVALVTWKFADLPLKVTDVVPEKFVPATVTEVPVGPLAGVKLVMEGALDGGGFVLPVLPLTEPLPQPAAQIALKTRRTPKAPGANRFQERACNSFTRESGLDMDSVRVRFPRKSAGETPWNDLFRSLAAGPTHTVF
ncbi:MAG TPA: hypothetical protein VLX32_03435 [Candidatus Acidoferrum sp.]|nr:hypothetical protein [Candidatus Acidoferrum sp.]